MAVVCFAAAFFYVLLFSPYLTIVSVNIFGCEKISENSIRDMANNHMSGKYLAIFPKDNLLMAAINRKKIAADIMASYKEIEKVDIKPIFPSAMDITIRERQLLMGLCASGECYLIDENGIAYKRSSQEELDSFGVVTLTDSENIKINLDENAIDAKTPAYLEEARNKLKDDLEIEAGNNFETPSIVSTDMRLPLNEGWKIYFSSDIPLEKEIEMLKAVLRDKIKDQRANLEYVDLRSDNKVFYKLKEQPPEVNSNTENQPATETEKKKKN